DGHLVANAPHMPVHLGSMDRSVETIIRLNEGDIHPGDVFALNAPYNGGTHLPDITVCTPVFEEGGASHPSRLGGSRHLAPQDEGSRLAALAPQDEGGAGEAGSPRPSRLATLAPQDEGKE